MRRWRRWRYCLQWGQRRLGWRLVGQRGRLVGRGRGDGRQGGLRPRAQRVRGLHPPGDRPVWRERGLWRRRRRYAHPVSRAVGRAPAPLRPSPSPPPPPPPAPSAFHNRAEWVVDLTTRADRDGRAGACAAAYATSRLAASNAARVHRLLTERAPVSDTVRAELGARHATTTPAWWGVRTMLAYRMSRDYLDPDFLGPRIIDRALLSLIITVLYWRVGADSSPGNGKEEREREGERGVGPQRARARARARPPHLLSPLSLTHTRRHLSLSLSLSLSHAHPPPPLFLFLSLPLSLSLSLSLDTPSLQRDRPAVPVGHHAGLQLLCLHALPLPGAGPVCAGAGGRPVPPRHRPGLQDGVGAHHCGRGVPGGFRPRLLRLPAWRLLCRLCCWLLRDDCGRRVAGARHRRAGAVHGRGQRGAARVRDDPAVSLMSRRVGGGGEDERGQRVSHWRRRRGGRTPPPTYHPLTPPPLSLSLSLHPFHTASSSACSCAPRTCPAGWPGTSTWTSCTIPGPPKCSTSSAAGRAGTGRAARSLWMG